MSIEFGTEFFFEKTLITVNAMLKDMKALKNPMAEIGYYGVESVKQHTKLKKYIQKLEKIKKIIESE
jgi:hypothetical protein